MGLINNKNQDKENIIHALWDCQKIKDLPEKVARELEIAHILKLPLTSQQLILHDNFCDAQTLVNVIWMLTVYLILSAQIDESPINPTIPAAKIKAEIKSTNKLYPNRNLAH